MLVFRLREDLCDGIVHSQAFVPAHKLSTGKPAFFQTYKEVFPTFGILLHAFGSADDLTGTVLVNSYGDKDTDIFKLSPQLRLREIPSTYTYGYLPDSLRFRHSSICT